MCAMKKEDFLDLAPGYVGDILYEHLHLLQTDATMNGNSNTRTTTPNGLCTNKNSKHVPQSSQNNNSKLSPNLSNDQMTESNHQNISTGNSFQSESSQMSPQEHVPYPYHQVSPSLASDGAAAAAMAVAAQHHALYNYSTSVGGSYPQGNVSATGGYDSYHQFYAAAMAATAMAAARSYGEGQSSTYGYSQISPTSGRDQQYSNSHHQHHSSLQYNPLSFSSSRGSSTHTGSNNALNRSLSSPPSQPYHSSFAVSFFVDITFII